ncbi:unnamed protein product, partial [marine sediment metagenome]
MAQGQGTEFSNNARGKIAKANQVEDIPAGAGT